MKNTGGVDLCQAHARFDMKFNLHLQYLKINRATNTCKEHILFFLKQFQSTLPMCFYDICAWNKITQRMWKQTNSKRCIKLICVNMPVIY